MKNRLSTLLTDIQRKSSETLAKVSGRPDDFSAMLSQLVVLMVLGGIAVFYYGTRAAAVTVVTVAVCWILDCICLILRGKKLHIHDLSAVVTGLTLAMMMPASVPYTIAAAAAFFAICIAKHPFGGHGNEPFPAAAAGYIFAVLSFPAQMLSYPKPFEALGMGNIVTEPLYSSFTKNMTVATSTNVTDFELLTGNFTGPMGATALILLAVCAVMLMSIRSISPLVLIYEIGTVMVYALAVDDFDGAKFTAAGGMLIFSAMFLSSDNSLTPRSNGSCIIFGVITGLIIIAAMKLSAAESPAVFASVIAAPFAKLLDRADTSDRKDTRSRLKRHHDISAVNNNSENS